MKLELGDVVIELDHITTAAKIGENVRITFENGKELFVYCQSPPEGVAHGVASFRGSADELMDKIKGDT